MTNHWEEVERTVWPVNVGDIEWSLRYSNAPMDRATQLTAASALNAYQALTDPTISQAIAIAKLKRARQAQAQAQANAKVKVES